MCEARFCTGCRSELIDESWAETLCARCLIGVALIPHSRDVGHSVRELPATLDGYVLQEELGRGGMGEVYLARQSEPTRDVAIKILRQEFALDDGIARFRNELKALTQMDHPFIAKVYDAGHTNDGRPYFAMEYVDGDPITDYCRARRLSLEKLLSLFLRLCEAVQHAHQKGLIHRDLKPSNILVVEREGLVIPIVIDFGIAKAIDTNPFLGPTRPGQIIGTPEYMSPEQTRQGAAFDTRSDVYSLGVVLFELLVGRVPLGQRQLEENSHADFAQVVREVEPAPPSKALAAQSTDSNGTRSIDAGQLEGDLDSIVLKALSKDQARRYVSAAELRSDIERYLRLEPVIARPPTAAYRISKFVARHTAAVVTSAVLVLVLVASLAAVSLQNLRIRSAKSRADLEAATASEVTEFLVTLFKKASPRQTAGDPMTVVQAVDLGVMRLETELVDQPRVRARLLGILGQVNIGRGNYKQATRLLEESLRLRRADDDADPLKLAKALVDVANIYNRTDELAIAEKYLKEALGIQRIALGPDSGTVAHTLADLGDNTWYQGRVEESRDYYQDSLDIRRRILPADHVDTATSLLNLGDSAVSLGDYPGGARFYEEAIEMYERVGLTDESPHLAYALNNAGALYFSLQEDDRAMKYLERSLRGSEKTLGSEHPDMIGVLTNLGRVLVRQGELDRAESLFRRSSDIVDQAYSKDHSDRGIPLESLGILYTATRDYPAARKYFAETLEVWGKHYEEEGLHRLSTLLLVADLHIAAGELDEAEALLAEILRIRERDLPKTHPEIAETLDSYATLYRAMKRDGDAASMAERASEIWGFLRGEKE